MVQNQAFSLPVHLRRCLSDRVTGVLSLLGQDGSDLARISLDDGVIVGIDVPVAATIEAGSGATSACARLAPLFGLPDMVARLDSPSESGPDDVHVLIADALLHGIKSVEESSRVSTWLGDRSDELEVVSSPFERFSESALGPSEAYFLSRVERPMKVSELVEVAAIDPELALRIVCAMRYAGVLVPTASGEPWAGDRGPFTLARHADPEAAGADELARAFYLVEEKLRSIQSGADHYAVLEVERRASIDRIKASYRELAKTFHPDRHAQLAAFDADIKDRLESIFNALTKAYSVVGNAREREAYDSKLHRIDQASGIVAPVPPPAAPPKPVRPSPPPPPDQEAPKVVKGPVKPPIPVPVVPPVPKAPKPPPSATKPPPAAPVDSRPRQAASQKPAPTEAPVEKPASQKAPPAKPTVQPDALFEHGQAYADSGDWERAVQAFMRGTAAAPEDARMHSRLGEAMASLHGLDKRAEAVLRKALELDSKSADRFVEVAGVYLRFDRPEDAKTLFKRAVLIDPDNVEARAALDKLGVPGLSNTPQPGFFKRIFRKT